MEYRELAEKCQKSARFSFLMALMFENMNIATRILSSDPFCAAIVKHFHRFKFE